MAQDLWSRTNRPPFFPRRVPLYISKLMLCCMTPAGNAFWGGGRPPKTIGQSSLSGLQRSTRQHRGRIIEGWTDSDNNVLPDRCVSVTPHVMLWALRTPRHFIAFPDTESKDPSHLLEIVGETVAPSLRLE
ncbi:hypothetical protein E4U32_000490 [Claviceps aff. humidiphila group G2b]|nr:hypothetical protein E4U32_000490 [Claviceps aff. humidiphila group G2b]